MKDDCIKPDRIQTVSTSLRGRELKGIAGRGNMGAVGSTSLRGRELKDVRTGRRNLSEQSTSLRGRELKDSKGRLCKYIDRVDLLERS